MEDDVETDVFVDYISFSTPNAINRPGKVVETSCTMWVKE
jgi:hypothetical protein